MDYILLQQHNELPWFVRFSVDVLNGLCQKLTFLSVFLSIHCFLKWDYVSDNNGKMLKYSLKAAQEEKS